MGIAKISLFAILCMLLENAWLGTTNIFTYIAKLIEWILRGTEPLPTHTKPAYCEGVLMDDHDDPTKRLPRDMTYLKAMNTEAAKKGNMEAKPKGLSNFKNITHDFD